MSGTLKASLASSGSLDNSSSSVSVVMIVPLLGVPNVMFGFCIVALLHSAFLPISDFDAAVSRNAVLFCAFGGLLQPGEIFS